MNFPLRHPDQDNLDRAFGFEPENKPSRVQLVIGAIVVTAVLAAANHIGASRVQRHIDRQEAPVEQPSATQGPLQ